MIATPHQSADLVCQRRKPHPKARISHSADRTIKFNCLTKYGVLFCNKVSTLFNLGNRARKEKILCMAKLWPRCVHYLPQPAFQDIPQRCSIYLDGWQMPKFWHTHNNSVEFCLIANQWPTKSNSSNSLQMLNGGCLYFASTAAITLNSDL